VGGWYGGKIETSGAAVARGMTLPAEFTGFIGRRRELTEVKRLLSGSRLVTLTGIGGVGKTRLSLRAAADLSRAICSRDRCTGVCGHWPGRVCGSCVFTIKRLLGQRQELTRPTRASYLSK
jgi:hypothetical protein